MKTTCQNEIRKFGELFSGANEAIEAACAIYVHAIDEHGLKARKAFRAAFPDIPGGAWSQFEKVGRGMICVEMLTNFFPAVGVLEAFPVEKQRQLLKGGVTVYQKHGKVKRIPVKKLNSLLVRQVFEEDIDGMRVRNVAEQSRWRKEYDSERKGATVPYKLAGGKMYIGSYELTVQDLELIIAELKTQAGG